MTPAHAVVIRMWLSSLSMPSKLAAKSNGVCSNCLAKRQLHLCNVAVHHHGARINPCTASHCLLLALSSTTCSSDGSVGRAAATQHSTVQIDQTTAAIVWPQQGHSSHHRVGRRFRRHISRGASFSCSLDITKILHDICYHPCNLECWWHYVSLHQVSIFAFWHNLLS